jgi:DNA topoisomerase-3
VRLILSEKPSMGRAIAAALGIAGSGRHAIHGRDSKSGETLVVTWCVGHLVQAVDPEGYDPALKRWTMATLPLLPAEFKYEASPSTMDQWLAVRELLQDPELTSVVNATDAGREGQLIFHLAYALAGCAKPVKRLWTSSLTDDAIRDAWAKMKPDESYRGLTDAARCRQEADWLVGLNCTRAQTLVAKSLGGDGVYSVGRVQTPTLAILVLREKDRTNFVPKDFWTVVAQFRPEDDGEPRQRYKGTWFQKVPIVLEGGKAGTKDEDRFDREADALALVDKLQGQPGIVTAVSARDDKKKPELLYDLTALQKEANKRFGMTAEHTLEIAQQLYEAKLISYPRTNSRHLTHADAAKASTWLDALRRTQYSEFVQEIEKMGNGKAPPLSKRFVDDKEVEDHSGLTVTEKAPQNLAGEQAQIYDLIARRLLAAWFPDRIEAKTEVVTTVAKTATFKSFGNVLKDAGWSRVDPPAARQKTEVDESAKLPRLKKGEVVATQDLAVKKGQTSPPKAMTEGDLLTAMQTAGRELDDESLRGAMKDSGLGTPATRANIIETLIKRGYVERKQERKATNLVPTEKGIQLIDSIQVDALKSPLLTGQWEAAMEQIRRGTGQRDAFMADIRKYVTELVTSIRRSKPVTPSSPGPECPRCGSPLLRKTWDQRDYMQCTAIADPQCRVSWDVDAAGKALTRCKFCTGPVSTTRAGKQMCQCCGLEQDDVPDRPPPPALVKCETCKQIARVVWSEKKRQYFLRCQRCDAWPTVIAQATLPPQPSPPPCPGCQLPMAPLWSFKKRSWYSFCEPCQTWKL